MKLLGKIIREFFILRTAAFDSAQADPTILSFITSSKDYSDTRPYSPTP